MSAFTINQMQTLITAYIGAGVAQYLCQSREEAPNDEPFPRGEMETMADILAFAAGAFDNVPAFVPATAILYDVAEHYGWGAAQTIAAGHPFDEHIAKMILADALEDVTKEWKGKL